MTLTTDESRYPADFEERLLAALLATHADLVRSPDDGLHRSPRGTATARRQRLAIIAAIAAVIVALGVVAPLTADRGDGPSRHATRVTTPPVKMPWRLDGDVTPSSWGVASSSSSDFARGLACPTASFCVWDGVGGPTGHAGVIMISHDSGATWKEVYTAAGDVALQGATCPSATTCAVAASPTGPAGGGGELIVTNDAGRTWHSVPLPAGLGAVATVALSCTGAADCVVGGVAFNQKTSLAFVDTTSDGGTTWTPSKLPNGLIPVSFKCFVTGHCVTAGYETNGRGTVGASAYSSNGGRTWSAASVPPGTAHIQTLSCADASHCVAMTLDQDGAVHGVNAVLTSDDGGAHWSDAQGAGIVATGEPIGVTVESLACQTTTVCWATGQLATPTSTPSSAATTYGKFHTFRADMLVSQDGGETWTPLALPRPSSGSLAFVNLVSCASSGSSCFAGATVTGMSDTEVVLSVGASSASPQ